MTKRSKTFTTISALFTGLLWLMAVLFPVSNFIGMWAVWHLLGFGMLLYFPIPLTFQIIAIAVTANDADKDARMINILSLIVSFVLVFISLSIGSTWGVFW